MTHATPPAEPAELPLQLSPVGDQDIRTVDANSRVVMGRIDGVEVQLIRPHVDARGMLAEVVNFDDPFWREPIVYVYSITVEPGRTKGWGMHARQVDRHHVHSGRARFVLHDARVDSPTHGATQVLWMGDEARGAVRIPAGVWHAVQNVGPTVAHITNFPTIAYDHAAPDKQLLPLDTDLIPFRFDDLDTYGR